jgi:hypothetical protein
MLVRSMKICFKYFLRYFYTSGTAAEESKFMGDTTLDGEQLITVGTNSENHMVAAGPQIQLNELEIATQHNLKSVQNGLRAEGDSLLSISAVSMGIRALAYHESNQIPFLRVVRCKSEHRSEGKARRVLPQ